MPHVSSKQLNKETLGKIYKLLNSTITSKDVPSKLKQSCFDSLLTSTEKTMLAKRLAAIVLLSHGVGTYKASVTLSMSESTMNKLRNQIEKGKFKDVIKLYELNRSGPLGKYIKNLFRPLPKYGTSPSSLFKK